MWYVSKPSLALIPFTILSLTLTAACTRAPQTESLIAKEEIKMSALDVNMYPVTKTVCDPWGGEPDPRSNQGLKAELWQLESGKPRQHSTSAMIANGKKSDRDLFFTHLNVPTRMFDLGFSNEAGDTVKSDNGETLIEYFALRFKSILRLAPDQKPGLYEFALLSDDGAVLKIRDEDGVYRANVDNDGDHETRLGCGGSPIALNADTELPVVIDYYQGPRYHISLIVLMREFKDRADNRGGKDPACGVKGNETWFNPNNRSEPKKAYKDLLARDWKPLTKENYALANEAVFNPCKDGEAPVISGFRVFERFTDGFAVNWTTNIPATSQLIATDNDGNQIISTSDNVLRTTHDVRIRGLKPDTLYKVQAVSISETYGRALGPVEEAVTDF
ncbi:MAG: hypothetical protein RBT63_11475 [Bdellovibrionales bacterium]|jgi:hypothetical protein|nr:hypothetical protein [Bdellovibrionales bacterium]